MTAESGKARRRRTCRRAARSTAEKETAQRQILICPPDAAGRSVLLRLLGYAARVPIAFCAVIGFTSLLLTACQLGDSREILLPAAAMVVWLFILGYGRWYTTLGGVALGGAWLIWLLSRFDNWGKLGAGIVRVGINGVLQRLYAAGYYGAAAYQLSLSAWEEHNAPTLMSLFLVLLTGLIALLIVPFMVRKIRIAVPLAAALVCMVPVFTFNLPVSNWAVTEIIASCSALLVMWGYQRRYSCHLPADDPNFAAWFSDQKQPKQPKKEPKEPKKKIWFGKNKNSAEHGDHAQVRAKKERAQRRRYDRATKESREAMGALAGFCVLALVLIVLLLPSMTVDAPFQTIDAIDRKVQYYRQYVTATLHGDESVLEMYTYEKQMRDDPPHSTTAQTLHFDYIDLMRVGVAYDTPIYLQGWVGVNYADGAWSSANAAQWQRWNNLYGVDDMPSERAWRTFFSLMAPSVQQIDASQDDLLDRYDAYDTYGFVSQMVHIRTLRQMGSELYLPRVTNDSFGVLEYRTTTSIELPWAIYYDGVAVSSAMNQAGTDYSVAAFIPLQTNSDWNDQIARLIVAYNASVAEILRYEETKNKTLFTPNYQKTYVKGIGYLEYSPAQQYIEQMLGSERLQVQTAIKQMQQYADFVYDTYLDTADSEIISALAQTIYQESYADEDYLTETDEETGLLHRVGPSEDAEPLSFALAAMRDSTYVETYTQRHQLAMAVINYLVEHYTYTQEITTTADESLDGVENFLTVTGEGYCVQFASAAALLLREYGIPVRYMEGYLCSEFTRRVGASSELSRYVGTVQDSDKHAWIEVWYDGIGWVIYETTPAYYTALYGDDSTTAQTISPITNVDKNEKNEQDDHVQPIPDQTDKDQSQNEELPSDDGDASGVDYRWLLRVILTAMAILAAVAGIVCWMVWMSRRAKRAQQQRTQLAKRILDHDPALLGKEANRADAAKTLIRNLMNLFALYGTAPQTGELREDYAMRLSFAYEESLGYPLEYDDTGGAHREVISRFCFGSLLEAMAKEEFGYGMSKAEMAQLADLYLALHHDRALYLSLGKRLTLHYVKRCI